MNVHVYWYIVVVLLLSLFQVFCVSYV